ncbi:MAG: TPM domain-containing protein [Eubacteriales bacterium]|nr:TPM domain-containing protein [Eubacteriales bacterium]
MKKTVSLLLLIALLSCIGVSAFAFEGYVFDEKYAIKDVNSLNAMADDVYNKTGIVVSYFFGQSDDSANGHEQGQKIFQSAFGDAEGMMLIDRFDDEKLCFYCTQGINSRMTRDASMALLEVYNSQYDYDSAVREYIKTAEKMLEAMGYSDESSAKDSPLLLLDTQTIRIHDEANVLSGSALNELNSLAGSISEQYRCDVCAVFTAGTNGKDIQAFADDYYDNNGCGYGDGRDGIILAVDVLGRKFALSTHGFGITAFTDYGQQYLDSKYLGALKNNDWASAAKNYIEGCGELLYSARNSVPYDSYVSQSSGLDLSELVGINLVVGFVISFALVGAMKRKHKSVEKQYSAHDYMRPGSFSLGYSNNRFIRSQVARVRKTQPPQNHSSGGGSSVHFSSSGRSHGGHSGSF